MFNCSQLITITIFYSWLALSCTAIASVVVSIGEQDYNPVDLSIVGDREVAENSPISLQIQADFDSSKILTWIIDEEPSPIGEIEWTFEILEAPANMTIDADGQLNWIGQLNSESQLRSQQVVVRATANEKNGDRHWAESIETNVFVLPLAPRAWENPLNLYYDAGILGSETIYIYDADDSADAEQLQFIIQDAPVGCHITESGILYWTPPLEAEGQVFTASLWVADGNEHGQGPSLIDLQLNVTEAPAGAKSLESIYNSTPGFGSAICRDQERLVIGADQYSQVFIYEDAAENNDATSQSIDWQNVATLTGLPLTVEEGSEYLLMEITPAAFGASVAADGDWLLVGAPLTTLKSIPHGDDSKNPIIAAGAAFFYRRDIASDEWELHQVVYDNHNSYSDPYQFFGASVALKDGVAILSNDSANDKAGEVALYAYNSDYDRWERHDTIGPYDIPLQDEDYFSYPLVFDGHTLAIAANEDDSAGLNAGAVYLFEWPTTYPVTYTKITAQTPQTFGLFGQALALADDWLAIAAPNANQLTGEVELWQRQSNGLWEYRQSLSELGTYYYGQQLSLEAGTLAVSSPGFTHNDIEYEGRIYLYRYDGQSWVRILKHHQEDYQATNYFGYRIALSPDGQSLHVTAPESKLAYHYSLSAGDFPAESHPADWIANDLNLSDAQLRSFYQSDSTSPASGHSSPEMTHSADLSNLIYTFPERTDATGFSTKFEFSRNLKDWHALEDFNKINSTRKEHGWLHRISIQAPQDAQPFFIRQFIER